MHLTVRNKRLLMIMPLLIVGGGLLDWGLGALSAYLHLPLYLSNLGTVIVSIFGGALPAALLGFLTDAFCSIADPNRIYFGLISVIIGISVSWTNSNGTFKSIPKTIAFILIIGTFSGILGSILSWFLYDFDHLYSAIAPLANALYATGKLSKFFCIFFSAIVTSIADTFVIVGIGVLIYNLVPDKFREKVEDTLHFGDFRKMPKNRNRASLMTRVITIIIVFEALLCFIAAVITFVLYQDIAIKNYSDKCNGVAETAALMIDPDKIDDYLTHGRDAEGYAETEKRLYDIQKANTQIQYIYVYRIEEDGCHVVFNNTGAAVVNSVVPFENSLDEYRDALLSGEETEPIITNDKHGWLLTVYKPIRNAEGTTVCYVAADINMNDIVNDQAIFIIKMVYLVVSVSIIVVYVAMELIKYGIIFPVNRMANATENFALDTDEVRTNSLSRLYDINIRSNDELENLYSSLCKMATDSTEYIQQMKTQADIIVNMQSAIIWDFAEMVEARDKCTGDHVKTTSAYVEAIAKELRQEGEYPDILTDEYIEKIRQMAPLHDIGKIKISDLILNKPGKLTEEEFELMKTHTTEGRNILMATSSFSKSDVYLKEAIEMATYHHERWDGKGYPEGLKENEIPLSARIMAVADVFDALVSKRSYKEPFSFEKATAIIREESGSHFDPIVAKAFLNISEKVYKEIACHEAETKETK